MSVNEVSEQKLDGKQKPWNITKELKNGKIFFLELTGM